MFECDCELQIATIAVCNADRQRNETKSKLNATIKKHAVISEDVGGVSPWSARGATTNRKRYNKEADLVVIAAALLSFRECRAKIEDAAPT